MRRQREEAMAGRGVGRPANLSRSDMEGPAIGYWRGAGSPPRASPPARPGLDGGSLGMLPETGTGP